jgi:hypothetical protein
VDGFREHGADDANCRTAHIGWGEEVLPGAIGAVVIVRDIFLAQFNCASRRRDYNLWKKFPWIVWLFARMARAGYRPKDL